MIKMVVFLGNPGNQYKRTRHNIGWIFEELVRNSSTVLTKFKALYYKNPKNVVYLLPQTLMNNSGEAVIKAMQFFKIKVDEILVIHDDLETVFGSFKLKNGGGLAGHNGLRSIAALTGSKDFHRLALGISRPKYGSVSSYVLGKFTHEEEAELELFLTGVVTYFNSYISGDDKNVGKKIAILQQIKE